MLYYELTRLLDLDDVLVKSTAGTLFFRSEGGPAPRGDNKFWFQQYPSYANRRRQPGVVIDLWTDNKIVDMVSIFPFAFVSFPYSVLLQSSRVS